MNTIRFLQVGDVIQCHDSDDMIRTDRGLIAAGYDTEFCYEQDGRRGYWIEVIGRATE